MNASNLLAEITAVFQDESYPGELNIVVNNTPNYDLESLQIRDTFKLYTWQSLPDELIQYEQGGFTFLSNQGLRYYLPAYLRFPVRDFEAADSIPDNLIYDLTIPAETDVLIAAFNARKYQLETVVWLTSLQNRLQYIEQDAHRFIERYGQFNFAQSRAILHFLEYMRDQHGSEYPDNEPGIAIERYWFQFA